MPKNAQEMLETLRAKARERRQKPPRHEDTRTLGARTADAIAALVGSWRFIIVQSAVLAGWLAFNAISPNRVDPYPFILLNLMLSFQAAYAAPIIMMSQNRQSEIDRRRNVDDFEINRKAELEIESLHEKVDLLREREIAALALAVERLTLLLENKRA